MTKIKVCGLTSIPDIEIVNQYPIDYAGFVLYYPKSKRNITLEQAKMLRERLKRSIRSVAVTVSPSVSQVMQIEQAGFDIIQIHGILKEEVEDILTIPIFRAVNVETEGDVKKVFQAQSSKIQYYVFDGKCPGGGVTFDWKYLQGNVDNTGKIMLAGGLNDKNVSHAIHRVHPGIVDVSSSVEKDGVKGKDRELVERFVNAVLEERKVKV